MTYCVGVLVEDGLVMIADTRTNAGLDNISTYRKLHHFNVPGERVMMLASAGNLSITQSVLSLLAEGVENRRPARSRRCSSRRRRCSRRPSSSAAPSAGCATIERAGFEAADLRFDVSLLFGGQIGAEPMRLYMIYSAGNFIECSHDAPFLQIGEHKYGKPILDRAVKYETDLYDALKVGPHLDGFDHALEPRRRPAHRHRGRRGATPSTLEVNHRIEAGEPYFHDLRERWSAALRAAHRAIPRPPYGPAGR